MRYGDLEMFLCGLELTHLLPKFQVMLHFIISMWEYLCSLDNNTILPILNSDANLEATQV